MRYAAHLLKAAVLGYVGLWLVREAVAVTIEVESERYMVKKSPRRRD